MNDSTFSVRLEKWPLSAQRLAAWDAMAARLEAPPDLWPEWAISLIEGHGLPAAEVLVAFIEDDAGALRGVVPLRCRQTRRRGLPVSIVGPLNNVFSLQLSLLADIDEATCLRHLVGGLSSAVPGWSVFELAGHSSGESLAVAARSVAAERGCSLWSATGDRSPFLVIDRSWPEFLQSKSANFRYNMKRKAARLAKAGAVDVRFLVDWPEISAALSSIQGIEARSWKADEGSALTSRPSEFRFYRALLERLAPRGTALVTLLELGGVPVAYDMSLTSHGKGWCLKTSFDRDFAELSVGLVLRSRLMEHLFTAGLREYDFLGKDERYKLEWTDTVRTKESFAMYNPGSVAGRLYGWRSRLGSLRQMFGGAVARGRPE